MDCLKYVFIHIKKHICYYLLNGLAYYYICILVQLYWLPFDCLLIVYPLVQLACQVSCTSCKVKRSIEDPNDILRADKGNAAGNAAIVILPGSSHEHVYNTITNNCARTKLCC